MTLFQYHHDIMTTFPNLVGGVIVGRGLRNGPTPDGLASRYLQEQQAVIARIGGTPLSEIPALSAWRSAFRKFGVEPTQYRCASESLLRRLTKKGDIPLINTLVDAGNLVSIRYALPIAIVDTRAIRGGLTVHFADGTESFTPLDQAEAEHPELGEVIFSDERKQVAARRWCWRQSNESAARDDTTDVLVTIEAHHSRAQEEVQAALNDLLALLGEYASGQYETALLNKERLTL